MIKALEINNEFYVLSYNFRKILRYTYLKEMEELYSIAYIFLNTEMIKKKEQKIMEAIAKRQQDLEYNQRRMIDNVMEREFKKINIDRLIVQDKDGEDILVTNEGEIKKLVANHFQNCAGSINCEKEIPDEWIDEYRPKEELSESIYDSVLTPITLEEIIEIGKMLPGKKANGPTGISYEDIKLTLIPLKEILQEIFNEILETGTLPKDWLRAHIYPIPKPKPWQYDLNNTRPITLLETARKFFVKILTNRLSKIFTTNDILKGYQFAGLPKKSTFEPLRIVNEIINYAEQNKKEMWFLMLDMSKAYDRINIPMLRKALERIKMPKRITQILTGLFTNRTNQVFTPTGLTEPFDMLTGIDQGEIISPLLWIIYYDPLLARIRNTNLGFRMEAKEYLDVYENVYRSRSVTFPGCAYMDDTGFITNNKLNLERILKIADSFYRLNDIKINKQKSELLLRKNVSKKKPLESVVKIKFGEDEIEVKPTARNQSSRFLGVWINAFNDNRHVEQQIRNEIKAIIKNISCRKGITDKMMIYLFNMLIIPIVEYRSQLYVIEERILERLMAPFRSFIKNRLKFAKTAPNAILETHFIYNLNNLVANQKQAKITNFVLQVNDTGILGKIMEVRFINIQQQLLLENHPIYVIDEKLIHKIKQIKNIGFKFHFILNNIKLLIENNFKFARNDNIMIKFNVEGGPTLIRDVVSNGVYIKNFMTLQDNNLIFVDQITILDKKYLLSIEELEMKSFVKLLNTKRMSKKNGKLYENILADLAVSRTSYRIKPNIVDQILFVDEVYNLKGTILLPTTILPEKGATVVSKMTRGVSQNRTIFGRIIKIDRDNNVVFFNHFENLTDDYEKNIILRKCKGCELGIINADVFKGEIKSNCLIVEHIERVFLLSPYRWNKQHHSKRLQNCTYYYEGVSVNFYDEILRYDSAFRNNIIQQRLDNKDLIQYDDRRDKTDNVDKNLEKGSRYNIAYQRIKRIKDRIALNNSKNISIYIDGSVKGNKTEYIKSIFGVMIYDEDDNLIDKYFSTVEHWLTSTKAETMAFFTALLMIQDDKNYKIYTDSQNVIKNYRYLTNRWETITTRDLLKFDKNNAIWFNIKEILDELSQQIDVIKVESHSDNKLHNTVDKEIKDCYEIEDKLSNTLVKYNTEQYKFPVLWNNYVVEMNLRRFIRLLTRIQGLEKFFNLNRNWRYRILDVKWEIVFAYIGFQIEGDTTFKTDNFICKQKRMKIQRLIEEIPTIEQMKKSSYDIYRNFRCVFCHKKKETFNHVWTCRYNRKILKQIIERTIDSMVTLLKEYGATFDEVQILTNIKKLDIFFPKFRDNKFNFVDLIKGVFPIQLYDFIGSILGINNNLKIIELGTKILQYVMDETKKHIWLPRCEKLKIIEKNYGINKKDKKRTDSNFCREKQEEILQYPENMYRRYEGLEGVKEYILFGKEILDFTVVVNRVGKIN
jgi:ribonuclease HI